MIEQVTALSLNDTPGPAQVGGSLPFTGPLVTLDFILPLGGPVPNIILPPVPQSCQNSCPNVVLQATIVDQDGNAVDLSGASAVDFFLLAPDGVPQPVAASFVSNGMDGLIQYVTTEDDLTERGLWQIQAQITFGTQVIRSRWAAFNVDANIGDF